GPEMIVREQDASDQSLSLQFCEEFRVAVEALCVETVETNPCSEPRHFKVRRAGIILRMHPNERGRCDTFLAQDSYFVHGGEAVPGVNRNGKTARQVNARRRAEQFRVQLREFSVLDAKFQEAGSHTGAVNSVTAVR